MAIKSFKPYSAGRRFMTVSAFDEITASKPEKWRCGGCKGEEQGELL